MKTISSREAHNSLGNVLDCSQLEPVVIEKNGKPFSVVVSMREFEEGQRLRMQEEVRIDARLAEAEKSYEKDGGVELNQAFCDVKSTLKAEFK